MSGWLWSSDPSRYDPLPILSRWLSFTQRYLLSRAFNPKTFSNWGGLPECETPDYPPPFRFLSFWSRHGGRHEGCGPCDRWRAYWSRPVPQSPAPAQPRHDEGERGEGQILLDRKAVSALCLLLEREAGR